MSEVNKALVRRYLREVVEETSEAAVDELVSANVVLPRTGTSRGSARHRRIQEVLAPVQESEQHQSGDPRPRGRGR